MTDETKRGSSGGSARAAKLSKEQRKAIASAAAKARWAKRTSGTSAEVVITGEVSPVNVINTPQEYSTNPVLSAPLQVPDKRHKSKRRVKQPKAFGDAHSYAERRLAEAIQERAEAMGKVAALNAEIPSLVQIINALKSTASPLQTSYNPALYQAVEQPAYLQPQVPPQVQQVPYMPSHTPTIVPPIPMAHGGAIGGIIAEPQDLPEDAFLRDTIAGGGQWS